MARGKRQLLSRNVDVGIGVTVEELVLREMRIVVGVVRRDSEIVRDLVARLELATPQL